VLSAGVSGLTLRSGAFSPWLYVTFMLSVGLAMLGVLGLLTRWVADPIVRGTGTAGAERERR
jgi:hypothetical protein